MSSLLLLTNPSFGSLGSSQNDLWKRVHSLWHSIHKSLQWLPLCINSKPHSCWPSLPTPAILVLLMGSASLISLRVPKQASTLVASYCPDNPVHATAMSSLSTLLKTELQCFLQGVEFLTSYWDETPPCPSLRQQTDLSCVALIVTQSHLLIRCYMKAEVESSRIFLRLECFSIEVSS